MTDADRIALEKENAVLLRDRDRWREMAQWKDEEIQRLQAENQKLRDLVIAKVLE